MKFLKPVKKVKWAVRYVYMDDDCFYGASVYLYIGPNGETSREDEKEWHFEDTPVGAVVEANRRKQREEEVTDMVEEGSYKEICFYGGPFDTLEAIEIK
jgi:hypothetical protein